MLGYTVPHTCVEFHVWGSLKSLRCALLYCSTHVLNTMCGNRWMAWATVCLVILFHTCVEYHVWESVKELSYAWLYCSTHVFNTMCVCIIFICSPDQTAFPLLQPCASVFTSWWVGEVGGQMSWIEFTWNDFCFVKCISGNLKLPVWLCQKGW